MENNEFKIPTKEEIIEELSLALDKILGSSNNYQYNQPTFSFPYDKTHDDEKKYGLATVTCNILRNCHLSTIIKEIDSNPEKKCNCLCFLADYRPTLFEKMFNNNYMSYNDIISCIEISPGILVNIGRFFLKNEEFRKNFIEIIKPEWYDYLPRDMADNPDIMKKCNRTVQIYRSDGLDSHGYNRDWINEKGELLTFFHLKGNFPIKTKLDYYKIYKEYVESRMSVSSFCTKYGIDSLEGFNELLERIKAESYDDFSKIQEVKSAVSKSFYTYSKEIAIKLANGEVTFEEFFANSAINFINTRIDLYYNTLSLEDKNKFSHELMHYFDRNTPLLHQNFIKFLTTRNNNVLDNYNMFVKKYLVAPKDREYYKLYSSQLQKLKNQLVKYYRKNMYCTYGIGDSTFEVNDEVIDQAYAYAQDNQLYVSNYSMSYLCKEIAVGRLNYSKETKEQKDEMIDVILRLVYEERTIEDYISAIKNSKINKIL